MSKLEMSLRRVGTYVIMYELLDEVDVIMFCKQGCCCEASQVVLAA